MATRWPKSLRNFRTDKIAKEKTRQWRPKKDKEQPIWLLLVDIQHKPQLLSMVYREILGYLLMDSDFGREFSYS